MLLSFTKQQVQGENQARKSRLQVGISFSCAANLHVYINKVDVQMDICFYTKALQTLVAFPVGAGVGKAHLSLSRLG